MHKTNKRLKAGGIVVKDETNELSILLLYRNKQKDWSFPKGHVDEGKTIKETVIRELKEETGLEVEVIKELVPNEYLNSRNGEDTITYMYLLKPLNFTLKLEHEGDRLEWVKLNDVRDRLSYENLKEYFDKIVGSVSIIEDGRMALLFRLVADKSLPNKSEVIKMLIIEAEKVAKGKGYTELHNTAPAGNMEVAGLRENSQFNKGNDYTWFWKEI